MIAQSESIASLAAALAKAQAVMSGATKDSTNPHFRNKYADLGAVWDAARAPLSENGLSVVQFPGEVVDGRMTLTTQLIHSSGEWMRDTMAIPLPKADPQGAGSAITYARRYALAAVVGVCPEDDDGNAASRQAPRQEVTEARINDDQRSILMTLAQASGADMREFCTFYRIGALPELPAARFEHAKGALERKATAKGGRNGNAAH